VSRFSISSSRTTEYGLSFTWFVRIPRVRPDDPARHPISLSTASAPSRYSTCRRGSSAARRRKVFRQRLASPSCRRPWGRGRGAPRPAGRLFALRGPLFIRSDWLPRRSPPSAHQRREIAPRYPERSPTSRRRIVRRVLRLGRDHVEHVFRRDGLSRVPRISTRTQACQPVDHCRRRRNGRRSDMRGEVESPRPGAPPVVCL